MKRNYLRVSSDSDLCRFYLLRIIYLKVMDLLFSKTFYQLFPLNLSFYNSTLSLIFTEEIDSNRLSSILLLKKLLQSLDLVITSLGSYFVIKDVGLPWTYFFFWGACLFSTSKFMLQNLYSPSSLFMNSSFESFSNTLQWLYLKRLFRTVSTIKLKSDSPVSMTQVLQKLLGTLVR